MRIVYMGSPEWAVAPLQELLKHSTEFSVIAAVSNIAKAAGRGKTVTDPPLAHFAKQAGIKTLQPLKASDPDFLEKLKALEPDVVITCAYGQILTDAFLAIPKRATINIHPSRLPLYRGATPVQSALLAGDQMTAITILFTVKKLDAGNIIVQKEFAIQRDERALELGNRLFAEAGGCLLEALGKLGDPAFQGRPQDETQVVHCKKIQKADGAIDWALPGTEILCRQRGHFPWPGSFTFFRGKRVVVSKMRLIDAPAGTQAGTFTFDKGLSVLEVATGAGSIGIELLKPEGSKEVPADAFWNGLKDKNSLQFTSEPNP